MNSQDSTITSKKEQALAHIKCGELPAAKALYSEICELDRVDADAWHMLSTINGQLGLYSECESCAREVLSLQPNAAAAHYNLGAALRAQKKLAEARASFRSALQLNPGHWQAHFNAGELALADREYDIALRHFEAVISILPDNAQAQYNLGVCNSQLGRLDVAESHLKRACALTPGSSQLLHQLGSVQHAQGHFDSAIGSFRSALEVDIGNANIHTSLGNVLRDARRFTEAIGAFQEAVRCMPRSAEAHYNLGHALQVADQFVAAVHSYKAAISLKPGLVSAYNNLGQVYVDLGLFDKALACYQKGLRQVPARLGAKAETPGDQSGQHPVMPSPEAEIHWHRAILWLLMGNFTTGWPEFEWRWSGNKLPLRGFPQPRWNGGALDGKTIFLYAEQGCGDIIQFIRYVPIVARAGGRIIIECQRGLKRLFSTLAEIECLVIQGEPLPDFDVHAPLLSLPAILHTTMASIPNKVPYLRAPALTADQSRQISLDAAKFNVGLVWAGNAGHTNDRRRSIDLTQFRSLLDIPGVHWVSLQVGERAIDLGRVHGCGSISDPSTCIEDFADTAAIISSLDLVISVDTAVAHLAGALGVPVWLLLPFIPDWRWMLNRSDTPWYPGMKLFRQPQRDDWSSVINELHSALQKIPELTRNQN